MKRIMILSALLMILNGIIAIAQPFGPPIYVADPVGMECRYYFAGNERHFNPRPDNYTVNIGYTTDFKNQEQACEFFRCTRTNGFVKVDESKKPIEKDLCVCPESTYWDDVLGCVKSQQKKSINFLQLIWGWFKGIFA